MNNKTIPIIIQHFHGCPSGPKMIEFVQEAILPYKDMVDYQEIIIDNDESAKKNKFRGSPTLLIDGIDFENMPEPENPSMACRFYSKGLPNINEIKDRIKKALN